MAEWRQIAATAFVRMEGKKERKAIVIRRQQNSKEELTYSDTYGLWG